MALTRISYDLIKRGTLYPTQYFTSDGLTAIFDLNRQISIPEEIEVFIDGVKQFPDTYSVNSTLLQFDQAPPFTGNKDNIAVEFTGLLKEDTTVGNGTITAASLTDSQDDLKDIWNKIRVLGTQAPTTGSYVQGDMVWNSSPTAGGFIGWVCVAAGLPGVWKGFGQIQA